MTTSFDNFQVPPDIPPRSTSIDMDPPPEPSVAKEYEDLQSLDVPGERGQHFGRALPPFQSPWRRICPTNRLVLVLMGFCFVLTLSVALLGIQRARFSGDQGAAKEALKSLNLTVKAGLSSIQEKRNDTRTKLAALEKTMNDQVSKMEKVKKQVEGQLDTLKQDSRAFRCELVEMRSNGSKTGCCPKGWKNFEESCYWMSQDAASWNQAKLDCEKKDAHLVIINSPQEKRFVSQRWRSVDIWIGLTDVTGVWKWVDGTSYMLQQEDWAEGQPDHWYGHGLGGGEDCVQAYSNGLWNDNHCSLRFSWMCEMELGL
ncbi:asialoglycoprotein receptor 1-like isoform X2 [Podarcis muralis]